jgi:hypothetical protein
MANGQAAIRRVKYKQDGMNDKLHLCVWLAVAKAILYNGRYSALLL